MSYKCNFKLPIPFFNVQRCDKFPFMISMDSHLNNCVAYPDAIVRQSTNCFICFILSFFLCLIRKIITD